MTRPWQAPGYTFLPPDWPPLFVPQFKRTREFEQSELSRINRAARVAQGDTGTIVGLSTRADKLISQRMHAQKVAGAKP